jgi:predicted ATPase with chaperone activity
LVLVEHSPQQLQQQQIRDQDSPPFRPQPNDPKDTGIDFGQHIDLCLKTLRYGGRLSGGEIANRLRVPYLAIAPALTFLKQEKLIEVAGAQGIIEQQYEYNLTDRGYEKATEALDRNQYVGPMPVPFKEYVALVKEQTVKAAQVTPDQVYRALSDLELSRSIRRMIGAAVNGGHSILLYGKPGNGKSSIAKRITNMLGGAVLIPHAVDVGGQTIRVFDPRVHSPAESGPDYGGQRSVEGLRPDGPERRRDRRWVVANRPLLTVGGELVIEDLDLKYSSQTRFYTAPLQMMANGGILVIDDFGRQRMRPDELLNRWIVPMEDGIDHYSLISGETIEVPFELLIVFSTNLRPENLGDEAFWRRIRHKIEVVDPDERIFVEILKTVCDKNRIEFNPEGARYLIETYYRGPRRPFRACHPRDLIGLVMDMAGFEGIKPELSPAWLDAACEAYFMEEDSIAAAERARVAAAA